MSLYCIVLPSVSTKIFQMFLCTNIDPYDEDDSGDDFFLTADLSISCSSTYYRGGLIYGTSTLYYI